LVFDRNLAHQFKVLTSPAGDYYWKPHLMAVIRRCPELAYFLPTAEFSDAGARVIFTRFSGNDELLTKTVGLDEQGVRMPESTYAKLQEALAKFKSMSGDAGLTPDESRFIAEFRLPDRNQFPGAYRILKTSWYASDRLFVLWGLEPGNERGTPVIKILAGAGNAPSSRQTGERTGEREVGGKPTGPVSPPAAVPVPDVRPPKSPGSDAGSSSGLGAVPVGSGSASHSGSSGVGGSAFGNGGAVVVNDRWRRWRGCLWLLLPLLLLLLLLLLLSQCSPTSCSGHAPDRYAEVLRDARGTREAVPPTVPSPEPRPVPQPSPKGPDAPKWWQEDAAPRDKGKISDRIDPLPKRVPMAPGQFEVYIHKPTELIQRPPAAEIHLGLRYHGAGKLKDVTWTLSDGAKEEGEFLDELVPFDSSIKASTEIDVTFTYVDADGVEHKNDGFSFLYTLEGKISFKEQIGGTEDKRTPAEKEAERKAESAKKAVDKGA
jgi:hypothetical protein